MLGDAQQFVDKFNNLYPDRELLFLFKAGSHFFDLNTSNSDQDFRGVYLPSPQEYYEGEGRRKMIDWKTQPNKKGVKNSKDDIDFTLFSLTKLLELLKSGDFNAMEMLHTPKDKILIDSWRMKDLRDIKQVLLVNDISAFLGFIKKEYRRYGINIYHYKSQEDFLKFLHGYSKHARLYQIWHDIEKYTKNDNHISLTQSSTGNKKMVPSLKVAQRMYQNTVTVEYVRKGLEQTLKKYGHRQKSMAKFGVEYKGLYHALRLIYEANDLFDHGEFQLPFDYERHKLLLDIKTSNVEKDVLFNIIDEEIEKLYIREKRVSTNKGNVAYRIDKILFYMDGMMKLRYIQEKNDG